MNLKRVSSILVTGLTLVLFALSAAAQNHPMPGSDKAAPVLCTGCQGINALGQANDGLPTWPYSAPITRHVGRLVDSSAVQGFQHPLGLRTVRARKVRYTTTQHGTAPPRVYIQLGSLLGAYNLDTFFTTTLPNGPKPANTLKVPGTEQGWPGHNPIEKIAIPDAYAYAESSASGWTTSRYDGQDRLYDFDVDDRGNVYLAYTGFGWGMVKDNGETGGTQFKLSATKSQVIDDTKMSPTTIISIKSGAKYYAIVADNLSKLAVYDVTDPAKITRVAFRTKEAGLVSWAKDDVHGRLAVINANRELLIYDYATAAADGTPLATISAPTGREGFTQVTVDEAGNFWTASPLRGTAPLLYAVNGAGHVQTVTVPGGALGDRNSLQLHYGDHYLAMVGPDSTNSTTLRLFKVDSNNTLTLIDTKDFFKKYYHVPPSGYATPQSYVTAFPFGWAQPIKYSNKLYLIYNAEGMGDVYEVQAGDSIAAAVKSAALGTTNPNSKQTEAGPFYGDIVTFRATSSNPSFEYNVNWNFGNSESGANNTSPARTGSDVTHQYTGINNANAISAGRTAVVTVSNDPAMTDSVHVSLKVPTARVGVSGTNLNVTSGTSLDLIVGDQFTDASDGVVEGHFATWGIDTQVTKAIPTAKQSAGALGSHTLNFAASYGQYDANFNTTGPAYVAQVTNVSYRVLPFVVSINNPTRSGTSATFTGDARKTTDASILTATTWTVTWALNGQGTPQTAPIGTIPPFTIPNTASVANGTVLTLKVDVDAAGLAQAAQNFKSYTATKTLSTPDPQLTATACANTNTPCSILASSIGGASTSDWTFAWSLTGNGVTKTGTTNPFTTTFAAPGTYVISLKVTKGIFDATVNQTLVVAGAVCGPPPTTSQITINLSCSTCSANQEITFRGSRFHYTAQECDVYTWDFGDGATGTGDPVTHTYAGNGTYTVTMVVSNNSSPGAKTTVSKSVTIGSGGGDPNPGPGPTDPCTKPSGIVVSYSGSKSCAPGTACSTTETVKFTATRGVGGLQTCDTTAWEFGDGGTSSQRSPSHFYTTAGTYTAKVTVTNANGSASSTQSVVVTTDGSSNPGNPGNGGCAAAPTNKQFFIEYEGAQSNCSEAGGACDKGETIQLHATGYRYTFQSCDKFEWNFGDGSATSSEKDPVHTFASNANQYTITLRVYNTTTPAGDSTTQTITFSGAPAEPAPVLSFSAFPTAGTMNQTVTFSATSNIDNTTGWQWNFGDGSAVDNSQSALTMKTSTITHTFTKTGNFTVRVTAKNANGLAQSGPATNVIAITDTPEVKFLLPVVIHSGGLSGSQWRTDVQVYTPDTSISATNPLIMTANFKGQDFTLRVDRSTFIYEDFMHNLSGTDNQGPVVITVKSKFTPMIWTRTYNTTQNGTFGQFIPAILLNGGAGGASTDPVKYYLAGLRNDNRFRTNIGFVNPTLADMTVNISVLDDRRLELKSFTKTLTPFDLVQFPIASEVSNLPADRPFSIEITTPAGQWVIAYASFIDGISNDPVYLQAMPENDLNSTDFKALAVPGVGHLHQADGDWRSDVTIFNPDTKAVQFDLEYYDGSGNKKAAAQGVVIDALKFLQYTDILSQGVLGTVPDSAGLLRLNVLTTNAHYPMTFSRTYFDKGVLGSYGQGIAGFATARANVTPTHAGIIPGVRNSDSYYTNVGLVNLSNNEITVTVTQLDPATGSAGDHESVTLKPNQTVIGSFGWIVNGGTLRISTTGGNAWAFASVIDRRTKDPEYVPATMLP
ncbi:MAG TPA: PKD domain-containing protein [Thermoanaerobaculia bacterium]